VGQLEVALQQAKDSSHSLMESKSELEGDMMEGKELGVLSVEGGMDEGVVRRCHGGG
jgi:hypothetical protein